MASDCVGFTLPGMIEEPGSFSGMVSSASPQRGPEAIVSQYRSGVEVVPDAEYWFEVLASDDEHSVARFGARGHAAPDVGGGAMEYVGISVATVLDGRFLSSELFEDDDDARAVARFEELRPQR